MLSTRRDVCKGSSRGGGREGKSGEVCSGLREGMQTWPLPHLATSALTPLLSHAPAFPLSRSGSLAQRPECKATEDSTRCRPSSLITHSLSPSLSPSPDRRIGPSGTSRWVRCTASSRWLPAACSRPPSPAEASEKPCSQPGRGRGGGGEVFSAWKGGGGL